MLVEVADELKGLGAAEKANKLLQALSQEDSELTPRSARTRSRESGDYLHEAPDNVIET
jgi:hypothetical protein